MRKYCDQNTTPMINKNLALKLFLAAIFCLLITIILLIYYKDFYMGEDTILQTIYFNLFFISLGLFFLSGTVKIIKWLSKAKRN